MDNHSYIHRYGEHFNNVFIIHLHPLLLLPPLPLSSPSPLPLPLLRLSSQSFALKMYLNKTFTSLRLDSMESWIKVCTRGHILTFFMYMYYYYYCAVAF